MKIFAVDTSAKCASVAITEDGVIRGEFFLNCMLTHSETLMPMTQLLFKICRTAPAEVDCFAVNCGPGSFTGIRIGVAEIKGMAYALNKPCVAVSALESMAYNFQPCDAYICCVMDARCSQVYNALFEVMENGVVRVCEDRALSIEELTEELKTLDRKIILVGDGAELCYNKMKTELSTVELSPENIRYQKASGVCMAAESKYNEGKTLTSSELMPTYLRLPQAQRELMAKSKNK